jgi:hypothetical protein
MSAQIIYFNADVKRQHDILQAFERAARDFCEAVGRHLKKSGPENIPQFMRDMRGEIDAMMEAMPCDKIAQDQLKSAGIVFLFKVVSHFDSIQGDSQKAIDDFANPFETQFLNKLMAAGKKAGLISQGVSSLHMPEVAHLRAQMNI